MIKLLQVVYELTFLDAIYLKISKQSPPEFSKTILHLVNLGGGGGGESRPTNPPRPARDKKAKSLIPPREGGLPY